MKKTVIFTLALAGTIYLMSPAHAAKPEGEDPAPDPGTEPAPVEFVGFSDAALNGAQGFITMHDACTASYPGSRMCKSAQFIDSPSYAIASGWAWIGLSNTNEPSGIGNGGDLNLTCRGWNSNVSTSYGLSVDSDGRFGQKNCMSALPVACCQ